MEKTTDQDSKDKRLKYVELPQIFRNKATDISLTCKQQILTCERLAKHLARKQSRTPKEFEQDEFLKAFVVKTADMNEKVIMMLDQMREMLQEIADDARLLHEGAQTAQQIKDQSETILSLYSERDKLYGEIHQLLGDRLIK